MLKEQGLDIIISLNWYVLKDLGFERVQWLFIFVFFTAPLILYLYESFLALLANFWNLFRTGKTGPGWFLEFAALCCRLFKRYIIVHWKHFFVFWRISKLWRSALTSFQKLSVQPRKICYSVSRSNEFELAGFQNV
jgi:hypothetical protein